MSGRNPNELEGTTSNDKLRDLASRTYKEQAIWLLNGFWTTLEPKAENFWGYVNKHVELDLEKGKDGCQLDEFNAHRFLEGLDATLTVRAMRAKLASYGVEKFRYVALVHQLMFRYDLNLDDVVNAVQGGNQEELEEAQRMLDEVTKAFEEVSRTAAAAKAAEEAAVEAEKPFKIAQEELNAALAELHAQEKAFNDRTEDLKRKSEEGGIVSRNRAKNELEQHLGTDPLPLRRAKLNTEAAERKADKARAPFKAAREAAEEAARAAEAALDEARARVAEAEAYLEEIKKKPGQPYGALWWMDRELEEQKKYLPSSKQ